ncbi:hypothetical protein UO65_4936 [Actinokineospora spheciospongiae]|uniref:Uncharacterized protein n=1 Tax=Actinokineospora spheciospongiae TaxID=909613 RepID=W7IHK1_9PSEU|nr:hypothetical protein UO65_4936 [Actinokineospora spheciospongiae]
MGRPTIEDNFPRTTGEGQLWIKNPAGLFVFADVVQISA